MDVNNEIDLFEHWETLPLEVQAVLMKYCDGENSYDQCRELIDALEPLGYTCDYDLSGQPHSLRLIKIDENEIEQVFEHAHITLAGILNGELSVEDMRKKYFEEKLAQDK